MYKPFGCVVLTMVAVAAGCGRDKQQEPPLTPAAGMEEEGRPQTQPEWEEGEPMMEGEPSMQTEPGMQGQPSQGVPSDVEMQWGAEGQAGAGESVHEDAVQLARAQCSRAERCNNVGSGMKYESREACEATVLEETHRELSACTALNRASFSQCLSAIDAEPCESTMSRLSDITQCNSDSLCM